MKFISAIQSFSDLITNSSSEVFLMHPDYVDNYRNISDECIDICAIGDLDWIKSHSEYDELFCNYLSIKYNWRTDDWDEIVDNNSEEFNTLKGLYIVEREDPFPTGEEV